MENMTNTTKRKTNTKEKVAISFRNCYPRSMNYHTRKGNKTSRMGHKFVNSGSPEHPDVRCRLCDCRPGGRYASTQCEGTRY